MAPPVLRDEGEQAMFDAIPFAGSGRQMCDRNGQPGLVGQRLQFASAVLEVADKLLLLRINRDGRLAGRLERVDLGVDVFEPSVPVRVVCALAGLAVRLQAETQPAQQPSDQCLARGESALRQRAGKMALALADPQQRRFGIAAKSRRARSFRNGASVSKRAPMPAMSIMAQRQYATPTDSWPEIRLFRLIPTAQKNDPSHTLAVVVGEGRPSTTSLIWPAYFPLPLRVGVGGGVAATGQSSGRLVSDP